MYDLILRQSLLGLLSLMLVLPASLLHVCRCSRSDTSADAQPATDPALKPCCAKRLAVAAASQARPTSPEIKAKCCCDELRWNQTVTQAPPVRAGVETIPFAMMALQLPVMDQRPEFLARHPSVAADRAPDDPVRITLGRWQV